jgi:hypothetical protein
MTVAFDGGKMTPYNPWKELVAAKNVANQQSAISN